MTLPVEISDKYEIESVISEDKCIYTALSKELGDKCVIKKVPGKFEKTYTELLNKRIDGIPRIKELFKIDNDTLFVAEQFIQGQDLSKFIVGNKERLDERWIFDFICQMAGILKNIDSFKNGIRHGEISASNLIISFEDKPYLIDFDNEENKKKQSDIFQLGEVVQFIKENTGVKSSVIDLFISKCKHLDPDKGFHNANEILDFINERRERPKTKESSDRSLYKGKVYKFLPPGFRTGYLWKMSAAVTTYLLAFFLTFSYVPDGTDDIRIIYINRICFFLGSIVMILFSNNYLGVQKLFGFSSSENKIVKYAGIAFCDVVIIGFFAAICVILENALK